MAVSFALSLLSLALLGWLTRQVWFYTGFGVQPDLMASNDALALLLFMLTMPVFTFLLNQSLSVVAPTRISGGRLRCTIDQRSRFWPMLFEVASGQCHDTDTRPVVRQVSLFHPPAAQRIAQLTI